jgi:hypothetical protein
MAILENQYLIDYIGKTATSKILNEAKKYVLENKMKILGYNPRPNVISLVHTENKNSNEIKQIGGSKPDDLVGDNLLSILAGMFSPPTTVDRKITLTDDGGNLQVNQFNVVARQPASGTTNTYSSMYNSTGGAVNCGIKVGSGSTPATRQDYDIETPFLNSPESLRNLISAPNFNDTLMQNIFATSFIAGGSGAIAETVLQNSFMTNTDISRTTKRINISRDNISPVVNFIMGESVFVEYVFQY